MITARKPVIAGTFYPAQPERLAGSVRAMLDAASASGSSPKVLIAPPAGHIYSGPVAASGYRLWEADKDHISRVVLLGPSHRVWLRGLALPSVQAFLSPLGAVMIDQAACARIRELPQVTVNDAPHAQEHSLEVHLPFLQTVLGEFTLVPLVVGETSPGEVAEVLDALWGGDETRIVISSDLSHFHPYEEAKRIDGNTTRRIEDFCTDLLGEEACGHHPINGLLHTAAARGMSIATLDLRNSGDTAGDRERVVGYGTYALQ